MKEKSIKIRSARKSRILFLIIGLVLVNMSLPQIVIGAKTTYRVTPESKIWFQASTALFNFEGYARKLSGTMSVNPKNPMRSTDGFIKIPVKTIDTEIDQRNKDMFEVMEASEYPVIRWELSQVRPADKTLDELPWIQKNKEDGTRISGPGSVDDQGKASKTMHDTGALIATVGGTMTMKGVSRYDTVPVIVRRENDKLKIKTQFPLDMTDYGIKPPSRLFISVYPEVDIHVELVAKP